MKFDGHFQLFFDIINKNTPDTYMNMKEARKAVHEYLRRAHEVINKAARMERQRQQN